MTEIRIREKSTVGENILLSKRLSDICPRIGEQVFHDNVIYDIIEITHYPNYIDITVLYNTERSIELPKKPLD